MTAVNDNLNLLNVPTFKWEHRSFSQFQRYNQCSEQYRLEKVEKAPQSPAAWLPQGTAFHEALEAWEKSARQIPRDEVIEIAVTAYDKSIAEMQAKTPDENDWLTGGRTKPSVDIAKRRDRTATYAGQYVDYSLEHAHEFWPAELPDGRPAVEVPFEIVLNGVLIRGAIDLMLQWASGALTVRDLKTGTKLPQTPHQLALYGIAWQRYFGDVIEYGDFFMCKNTLPTKAENLLVYTEAKVGAWVEMMDRSEKAGIYLPNPGDHCRVCPVRRWCSEVGPDANVYQMQTMKQLQEVNEIVG